MRDALVESLSESAIFVASVAVVAVVVAVLVGCDPLAHKLILF
jgi:hypothetical protein